LVETTISNRYGRWYIVNHHGEFKELGIDPLEEISFSHIGEAAIESSGIRWMIPVRSFKNDMKAEVK
jgi:hypothetical protein